MTDTDGWFADSTPDDDSALESALRERRASEPRDWPQLAVEAGFVGDEDEYYDTLHDASIRATRAAVNELERADDRQLVHAVRAMDDCRRTSNELAERLAEWAGTVDEGGDQDQRAGLEYAREIASSDRPEFAEPIVSLATRVVDLAVEADELSAYVERQMPVVAPNLSALAGPVLGARLISLGGGLESLAKKPSGTVQVLGAEEALFAHLRGHAPSPKHGIIYTHDAVRGTRPEDRGSAARALAGKLSIGARVDHYSGEHKPELEAELTDRIETIQARADGGTQTDDDETEHGGDDE